VSAAISLPVAGELTVQYAAEHKQALIGAVDSADWEADGAALELDLSGVTEIDTAGVQLLLLAQREVDHRGGTFRLVQPAQPVLDALALAGLNGKLGGS
jgi:anti-anti-sigma factor